MSANLPQPERDYSKSWAQQLSNRLTKLLGDCFMRGSDVRLENGERFILKDKTTGQRWELYIDNGVVNRAEVS